MLQGILVVYVGGGGEGAGGDKGDMQINHCLFLFWQNFITSQELMVARRYGPF